VVQQPFQELSAVAKPLFHKLFPNSQTAILSSTLAAENAEMRYMVLVYFD